MAETLDALRAGTPFDQIMAAIVAAFPFTGQQWERIVEVNAMYDNAELWPQQGAFEFVTEDLGAALDEGLISAAEYEKAITVVNS
ncbi:MAG: hypothetical protein DRJ50_09700 [Actinobacteria bacterium]|nr:MAG: hypothetical protein DRJ50_09700 [Actinomycetota bacterium]